MANKKLDVQKLAEFAAAYRRGEERPEAEEIESTLKELGKKVSETALQIPELLLFMADRALIAPDEIDKYLLEVDWTKDPVVTERLLRYKKDPPQNAPAPKEKKAPTPSAKDDWTTEKLPDGTLKLKSYKGKDTIIQIPAVLGKTSVTVIGDRALAAYGPGIKDAQIKTRKSIQKVIIPEGIVEIGEFAFLHCKSLTEVTIPESVTSFGRYAFCGCKSLVKLIIPKGIKEIPNETFAHCESLTELCVPEDVKYIGNQAFFSCCMLKSFSIPELVTCIGVQTFSYCTSLTEIHIPNNVTQILNYAFDGCGNLTRITIPTGVNEIGMGAFRGCPKLSIHAPAGSYAEQYAKENNIPFVAEQ